VLEAASSQSPVSNQLTAVAYDDPTYDPCPNSGGCAAVEESPITGRALVVGTLAFLGFALVRRRRR
jgi:MYXO-CTERM domain-containing protein